MQIVASEMRPTKDGGGQYLWLELDVLEGPLAGRKLFDRLNLVNASAQTVEIAQRTLSAICHATGRMQVQDSAGAAPDPDDRRRDVRPPKNGYGESNKSATCRSSAARGARSRGPQSPRRPPRRRLPARGARRRLRLGPLEALIRPRHRLPGAAARAAVHPDQHLTE